MHNPRHTKPNKLLSGLGLLTCLLSSLGSGQVLAIEGNMQCTGPGTNGTTSFVELGTLQPNQAFQVAISANCKALRTFSYGASFGHLQRYLTGNADKVQLTYLNGMRPVPEQAPGVTGYVCLPKSCEKLVVGTEFQYQVVVSGEAGTAYDSYHLFLTLNTTMIGATNYNEILQSIYYTYTVAKPTCTMVSNSNQSLPFGALSSNDFATSQQIADIKIYCPGSTQATASLSSPQSSPTGGTDGSTYTTLPQLLMIATWADTNTIVNFTQPRTFTFSAGLNTVSLGFRPKLVSPSATPSGNFASQYTLNITYL